LLLFADEKKYFFYFLSSFFQPISVPCPVPGQALRIPSRPVPWQDFELVPLSLCPGTMKEHLSLRPAIMYCPVLLETLAWDLGHWAELSFKTELGWVKSWAAGWS
jgi:hypothetical protein